MLATMTLIKRRENEHQNHSKQDGKYCWLTAMVDNWTE